MKKQKMRLISAVLAACMMTSVLPVNALALGGGTPENGVTAQEDTAATTIPFEGMTITEGGNYEIPEGLILVNRDQCNRYDTAGEYCH